MIGSVRGRLTLSVIAVVGAVAIMAALLAPRSVERALIDDRLDAEIPAEREALSMITVSTSGDALTSRELTAVFGPDILDLAASLEAAGALERLRSFRDDGTLVVAPVPGVLGQIETDGRVRVQHRAVELADGAVMTGELFQSLSAELNPTSIFDSPFQILASDSAMHELIADLETRFGDGFGERLDLGEVGDLGPLSGELFDEAFRELRRTALENLPELPPPSVAAPSVDQFVFGTRDVAGVEVIVAAPSDDIALTVDRLRTALWTAVPIAMVLTGLVTWLLAGRALRPVRVITQHTGRIRAGTLHERVPVPTSNDEVADLATEMNDMLDRLHREDQRRRQFVADASHELRSPIASIHTQAEVAVVENVDTPTVELATGVLAEAQRLGTIVDDLLALAHHDESLAPPGSIVDLDDVVLEAASRPRRLPIDTSRVSAGRVRGHVDELTRSVNHLLDNAARHATAEIQVSLATHDDLVVLTIDDDGPGIDPHERDRVFERFVRLDEARVRDDGGAGLGLAVVATVVSNSGGTVTVSGSDLGGARFRVSFPTAT